MKLIEDFNEILPLESLTAFQVVITIWNRNDIVRSITLALRNLDEREVDEMWEDINYRVIEMLQSIEKLPRILKEGLKEIIVPIGHHIKAMRAFANFSPYFESSFREFPVNHWTPYGTVETKQLNQILIQDRRRYLGFRYHLACHNCFNNIIMELFNLISDTQKVRFLQRHINRELTSYWTYNIIANSPFSLNLTLHNFENFIIDDDTAFAYTIRNGSKSGIEFFMNKLEHQNCMDVIHGHLHLLLDPFENLLNRDSITMRCNEHCSDALYFLLSKLSESGHFVSNTFYCGILMRFLMYPFYGLFNTLRKKWQENIDSVEIEKLLSRIAYLQYFDTYFFGYELFNDLWDSISHEQQLIIKEKSRVDDIFLYDAILNAEQRQN